MTESLNRRQLFAAVGGSAALAALLAACGEDASSAPGRVGRAPAVTDPPEAEFDDAMALRTLASLEASTLAVYELLKSDAGLDGDALAALDRFIADHESELDEIVAATVEVGGEEFRCSNPWYDERFFGPTVANVFGDDTAEPAIPPSDDVQRDALEMMYALEQLVSASHHRFIELYHSAERRRHGAEWAARSARRAATAAWLKGSSPDVYVNPDLLGESPPEGDDGPVQPRFMIANRFGQLTGINVVVGAINELGLRFTTTLQTPADNAYIYPQMTCS